MNVRTRKIAVLAATALIGSLGLTACSGNDGGVKKADPAGSAPVADLSGSIAGSGASSIESATTAWTQNFKALNPQAQVTYDAIGSGKGRDQFLAGGVAFAGSDAALKPEEIEKAKQRCFGGNAVDIPVYISPIAIVFKLDGVKELNLAPATLAGIFNGKITTWNDPAIAADNPGVELPATAIVPVHRSDKSGTTENFTEYLSATAGDAWGHKASGTWPMDGGQSGEGTSGLISVVEGGNGTIGYADASKAGNLATAKIKVGDAWVGHSAEGAAKAVEVSPRVEGRSEHDIALELDRKTTEAGAYPLVLVSYMITCDTYEDANNAELVKGFAKYVVSEAGQKASQELAGSAPLSEKLRGEADKAIDAIKAKG
ncbi:phosphate ABC transporter substrate-binding protein PstS [Dermabacteraceae bacterium TAE3-ERU27]|nr:phosphate ABC transporter substrate-binding protein PstS [Dermabacteraceae bacterium TAE3-ERU27]